MKFVPVLLVCVLVHCSSAGTFKESWAKDEQGIRGILAENIRNALNEFTDASAIPESKKNQLIQFITNGIYNYMQLKFDKLETDIVKLATLQQQILKDGAKLLLLRARWPQHQIEVAVDNFLTTWQNKLNNEAGFEGLHDSRMSALDLEHIIQDILTTLLQDPSAVALLQWLSTLPASLHRIADSLFTNKTFSEIFDMLGLNSEEEQPNLNTIVAPFSGVLNKADDKTIHDRLTGIITAVVKAIKPEIDIVKELAHQILMKQKAELAKLELVLSPEVKIFNEALWKKITSFATSF